MPRVARILSESQLYHIMIRGNNKEKIFKDDEDKAKILQILAEKKESGEYSLYAFCVMDNHLHLILKEEADSIGRSMKRIGISFAQYFNKKYKRVGHVFQDRYKSENIDTDAYLLAAIRYVHQNPAKAGIASIDKYEWSSLKDYLANIDSLVQVGEAIKMFSQDWEKGLNAFIYFHQQEGPEKFIDIYEEKELNAGNIKEYIDKYLKFRGINLEDLKNGANKGAREELIQELFKRSNLSKRNIATILGLNREMVRVAFLSREPSP